MDEDLAYFACFMLVLVSFPALLGLGITSCIAYSRTKAWDKARRRQQLGLESSRLIAKHNPSPNSSNSSSVDCVDSDFDSACEDSDFLDSDEETSYRAAKADKEAEKHFTFNQKFRKELKRCWAGGNVDLVKKREREQMRKMARAVAREIERRERRKGRKAVQGMNGEERRSCRGMMI